MEKIDFKKLQEIFEQIKQTNIGENTNIIPLSESMYEAYDKVNNKTYLFVFDKTGINDNSNSVDFGIADISTLEYKLFTVSIDDYEKNADGHARINFAEQCIEKFKKDNNKETLK